MLERRRKRVGAGKTPALDNKPELYDDLYFVWKAFTDLHPSRGTSGFGPLPLTTQEIMAWLNLHEVGSADERLELYELVRTLDRFWLDNYGDATDTDRRPKSKERRPGGGAGDRPRGQIGQARGS